MNFIFKAFYIFDSTLQFYFTIQRQYLILPTVNPAPHSRGSFTVWAIYSELFDLTTLNRHQNFLKSLAKIRRNGNMTSLKQILCEKVLSASDEGVNFIYSTKLAH